jgi:hypothetical protein
MIPPHVAEAIIESEPKRFWVYLLDTHPTKVPFAKDKLPVGIILPSVAIAPSLEHVKDYSQDINPVGVRTSPVVVYKTPVTISSYAFRSQKWCNLARDAILRLHKTPPTVFWLVGWLVSWLARSQSTVNCQVLHAFANLAMTVDTAKRAAAVSTDSTKLEELYYDVEESIYTRNQNCDFWSVRQCKKSSFVLITV